MSGQWPPEWDDQDDNFPGEAGKPDTEAEAGLSEVTAYLASVPAPLMPGSVEARISAALAVEAAARAGLAAPADGAALAEETAKPKETAPAGGTVSPRVLVPDPSRARAQARARARVLRRGAPGPRGPRDRRKALGQFVLGPLAVIVLLVVVVFGLSRAGTSSSSSSAGSAAGAPVGLAPASSSAASGGSKYAAAGSSGTSAPQPVTPAARSTLTVSETGTRYQQATLAQQARAQVIAAKARGPVPSAASTASSSSSAAASDGAAKTTHALTGQLLACVLKVTGGVQPELVDQATYQGTPAYVIVSSSHVWVVGLGCTASRQQVVASQPLAG